LTWQKSAYHCFKAAVHRKGILDLLAVACIALLCPLGLRFLSEFFVTQGVK
jgi:hypothetical protein